MFIVIDIVSKTAFKLIEVYPDTYRKCVYYRWFDIHILPQRASAQSHTLFRLYISYGWGDKWIIISFGNFSFGIKRSDIVLVIHRFKK